MAHCIKVIAWPKNPRQERIYGYSRMGFPFANGVPIREWDFEGFTIRDKKISRMGRFTFRE